MDGLAVFLIAQVEEQADLTMFHHHCTEEDANYVKLRGNQPSIGVKVGFLVHIEVINMKETW